MRTVIKEVTNWDLKSEKDVGSGGGGADGQEELQAN